jgi:hypothetical protein
MSNPPELLVDNKKVTKNKADVLYLQARISNISIILGALLFYFFLGNYSESIINIAWSSTMIVVALYRLSLWYQRNKTPEKYADGLWIDLYVFSSFITGLAWSSLFLLPYFCRTQCVQQIMLLAMVEKNLW